MKNQENKVSFKIPSRVKIGGHWIDVVFEHLENQNANFDWELNRITISDRLTPDNAESAFIHECLHAMNSSWGDGDFGHALLDSLAEQIYQLLSDNDIHFYNKSYNDITFSTGMLYTTTNAPIDIGEESVIINSNEKE